MYDAGMNIIVEDVPATVLDRLTEDARSRNVSVNETAVAILAKKYDVPRVPSHAKFEGKQTRQTILVSMPDELHRTLKVAAAAEQGSTMRGLIIQALAENYRLRVSAQRRPRTLTQ